MGNSGSVARRISDQPRILAAVFPHRFGVDRGVHRNPAAIRPRAGYLLSGTVRRRFRHLPCRGGKGKRLLFSRE